jgi:uncharacterized protein (TIGR01777 family)
MNMSKNVIVAGGTGLIGKVLCEQLRAEGHHVRILTRKPTNIEKQQYHWDPIKKEIDPLALVAVDVIINLVGEGIADERWTQSRKEKLISSRTVPALFLLEAAKNQNVQHYISASGINCYGYDQPNREHVETDPYGDDFLSSVVEKWETAANAFQAICKVTTVRIAVVLTKEGGALPKIAAPVKWRLGAALGSGKQHMPWITITDLARLFAHVVKHEVEGPINALANTNTNKEVTKAIAKSLQKPLWLPNVPAFVLKLALGEMASVLLDGLQASNAKIKSTGFQFDDEELDTAIDKSLMG